MNHELNLNNKARKNSIPTSQKTRRISIIKSSRLMMLSEMFLFPSIIGNIRTMYVQNIQLIKGRAILAAALPIDRLYPLPQKIFRLLITVRGWFHLRPTVRSEGLMQWKNQTGELPACSVVPQSIAPPRAPLEVVN